jgi:hypothetical protein
MKRTILNFVLLTACLTGWTQNKISFSGFIYNQSSGEILIGATVFDPSEKRGTVSNEYGFYSLTTPGRDSIPLQVSMLGYKQLDVNLSPAMKDQVNFYLEPVDYSLKEVSISATKQDNIIRRNETGVTRLNISDIKTLPNLFGEVDVIKALQLTPGVQSGGEAKSNLYVRGGNADQNLYLLDDVPLYYVGHFGGFFSVFNADAINKVKLIKGGFPARYGGRLSSILDVRMKEGNMEKLEVQGTVGLLSSKISVEAPVIKNRMSFILSVRKNILPIFKLMGTGIAYNFYDLNGKLNFRASERDKLFLSFYLGDDDLSVRTNQDSARSDNTTRWGNTLGSFRWNHIYSHKLFSNLTFSNTYFRNRNIDQYDVEKTFATRHLYNSILSGINDLSLKMDFTYLVGSRVSLRFGGNSIYHTFIPNDEIFQQSGTNMETVDQAYSHKEKALENALYVENEWKLNLLSANLGFRFTSFYCGKDYYSLEPRLLINYLIREDLSIKYSFSKMNQYVHLLSYSGSGVPSDYWMPTTENVSPETSIQHSIALAKTLSSGQYELSLEGYYKTIDNLIAFKPGESLMGNLGSWENVVEKEGTGLNYGIELFFQKMEGNTTGWIGATLSKAERTFVNLNAGEPFPFKYDRLLDVSIVVNQKLKKNIVLSATWTYGSGYPITLATEHYFVYQDDRDDKGEDIFVYKGINSFRMRDYHRLDVGANFARKTKWGERTWSLSIFNLYNRKNPYFYYYDRKLISSSMVNTGSGWSYKPVYDKLKLYQQSLFSFFPSFSYSFKF